MCRAQRWDLLSAKARGADVRMVYSPLDALRIARLHPNRKVVFLAVGFETTAPANAMAVYQAHRERLDNFFLLRFPRSCASCNPCSGRFA